MRNPLERTMNDVSTESQRFQLDVEKAGTINKVSDAYRTECDCVGKITESEPGVALMQYSDMIEAVIGITVDDPSLRKAAKRILRDALNELDLIEEDSNDH